MGFGSFLPAVEKFGAAALHDVVKAVVIAGPALPTIAGVLAGPAAPIVIPSVSTFVNFIVTAERNHEAKKAAAASGGAPVIDTRKQEVLDIIRNGEPLVLMGFSLSGHAIPNAGAFDQAYSYAIDTAVKGIDAWALAMKTKELFEQAFAPVAVAA